MSAWNKSGAGWKGQYWGQKNRGKPQPTSKETKKEADKNKFPTYDAMVVNQSEQSGNSSSSASGDSVWQSALRSLLRSNPGLNIPQEIATALDEQSSGMSTEAKSELYMQQKQLNMRRKATQRIERLQAALQRKKLQVTAFQEQMKQQLKQELDKFHKEKTELETQIKDAKDYLRRLEQGENMEEIEQVTDITDENLASMLGLSTETSAAMELQQARQEKDHAVAMASQMHQQLTMIMSHGANAPGMTTALGDQLINLQQQYLSPKRSSPQMPNTIGPFKRFKPTEKPNEQQETLPQQDGAINVEGMEWSILTKMKTFGLHWRIVNAHKGTGGHLAQVHRNAVQFHHTVGHFGNAIQVSFWSTTHISGRTGVSHNTGVIYIDNMRVSETYGAMTCVWDVMRAVPRSSRNKTSGFYITILDESTMWERRRAVPRIMIWTQHSYIIWSSHYVSFSGITSAFVMDIWLEGQRCIA